MNTHPISQQQADLLDEVYKAALDGRSVPVAAELDPVLAASARRVAEGLAAPAPTPVFAARLQAQLAAAAVHAPVQSGRRVRSRLFNFGSPAWRIAAALVLVAVVGAWLLSLRPQPVSAAGNRPPRAQATLSSPLAAGLQSYFIAEQTTLWPPTVSAAAWTWRRQSSRGVKPDVGSCAQTGDRKAQAKPMRPAANPWPAAAGSRWS